MLRTILTYGVAAGLIVGVALSLVTIFTYGQFSNTAGMTIGYLIMLVGLTAVFLGIKHRRDVDGGGVIRFWPALGVGLAISAVAGVVYVIAWDVSCAIAGMDFGGDYARSMVKQAQAKGLSGAAMAKAAAEAEAFRRQYADPLFRWPMTFVEIFPVGVLVSLISAAVLRNPRVLPARAG